MKKTYLFILCATFACTAFAQNYKITVSSTSGSYSTSKMVSFNVSWTNRLEGKYTSKVWVLVDYKNLTTGVWDRATVTSVNAGSSGSTITAGGRGFWLQGTSTNYNQKITVTLNTGSASKYSWCAHVSDYPPNVTLDNGIFTFKGTPSFVTSSQTVSGKAIVKSDLTVNASTTFTDVTDCPGIGGLYCPYTGSDLYMDPTHLCRQRTNGAQNWEAWIKDTRDNELYRIVMMPDNKWWLAQNVKLSTCNGSAIGKALSYCSKDKCGRAYTSPETSKACGGNSGYGANKQGVCPEGWVLPLGSDFTTLRNSISTTASVVCQRLRAIKSPCSGGNDYYGWASVYVVNGSDDPNYCAYWKANDSPSGCYIGLGLDALAGTGMVCGAIHPSDCGNYVNNVSAVRCLRP